MVWYYDPNNINNPANDPSAFQPFNRDTLSANSYIEAGYQGIPYRRPASEHPEVFNVVFVGGNTRAISETIDYVVFQQLMTPNGANAEYLLPGLPAIQEPILGFMIKQLSDSDY